jgi:hypothetical protein
MANNSKGDFPIGAFVFVGVIVGLIFLWYQWGQYSQYASQEMDDVCYNGTCDFMSSTAYSVNTAGTCLTETMFGSPEEQCGGQIDITKYPPISFWQWMSNGATSTPSSE